MSPRALLLGVLLLASGCQSVAPAPATAPFFTRVTGESMAPLLTGKGDEVALVVPVAIEEVQVGDLVSVWWGAQDTLVLHRVLAIRHGANGEIGLVTKGDANGVRDSFVTTRETLVGRVILPEKPTNNDTL